MRYVYLFLFMVIGTWPLNAQEVTRDFGDVARSNSASEVIQSVMLGNKIAVYTPFNIPNISNRILILDQNGLIENSITVAEPNTYYDVQLYSDGTTLFLMGYQGSLPRSTSATELANRNFVFKSYDQNGNLLKEISQQVLATEIGVLKDEVVGNSNFEFRQVISRAGAASNAVVVDIVELAPAETGQTTARNVISYYDRATDQLTRKILSDEYLFVGDMAAIGKDVYFYAFSGTTIANSRSVHTIGANAEVTSSVFQSDAYIQSGIAHFAEAMGNEIIEALAIEAGNPSKTRLYVVDNTRSVKRTTDLPNRLYPFGEPSLTAGIDGSFFLFTQDRNVSPPTSAVHKIDASTLSINWTVPTPVDPFSLYQSLAPTSDGGALVFGTFPISPTSHFTAATKIADDGTSTSFVYAPQKDWILGPNPSKGNLMIHQDALNFNKELNCKVYDLSGKLFYSSPITSTTLSIEMISRGSYIVQLTDKDGVTHASEKIVFTE